MNKQQQINKALQAIREIQFINEQDVLDVLTGLASQTNASTCISPNLKEALVDQIDEVIAYLESEIEFTNDEIQAMRESGELIREEMQNL